MRCVPLTPSTPCSRTSRHLQLRQIGYAGNNRKVAVTLDHLWLGVADVGFTAEPMYVIAAPCGFHMAAHGPSLLSHAARPTNHSKPRLMRCA
jgi:hypothetical protein